MTLSKCVIWYLSNGKKERKSIPKAVGIALFLLFLTLEKIEGINNAHLEGLD